MRKIDLHVHTACSDGTVTPAELVRLAKEAGLSAVAITDHDTEAGVREAEEAGRRLGIEVVPGIEISTKHLVAVHILGYYIDVAAPALREVLDFVIQDRDTRNRRLAEMMAADGLPVSYELMQSRFGPVIGRPHFAEILVELGLAESINDAFARFVNKGQRYYLPRTILPIERAVDIIVRSGGVAVLAHPFQYKKDDGELRELIEHCMEHGLRGLECRYCGYSREREEYLERLAGEYSLFRTGGSDFHGGHKPDNSLGGTGALDTPYEWLEELKTITRGVR